MPQWRIIAGGTKCIPKSELPLEDNDAQTQPAAPPSACLWLHPSDLSIALSASTPLYPPGRIIHVVHNHPPETWWGKPALWQSASAIRGSIPRPVTQCGCQFILLFFFPCYCITNAWTLPPYRKAALSVHTCDFTKKKKKNCNNSPAQCEKLHSFVGL